MSDVSIIRLYILRATYLLIVVGLGLTIWPGIIDHPLTWGRNQSVFFSILGTVGLLAVVGIRYPLAMLPLLFFELVWKIIWLVAFALPLWRADQIDAASAQTLKDCTVAIILPLVIPWGYVWKQYVRKCGDRWK
mgnify:CR=1 FL=1